MGAFPADGPQPLSSPGRVLLKIVYLLTCRVLGLASWCSVATGRRLSCWCLGTPGWSKQISAAA
jgi:hypothetical protein